jgi:4-hydroxybenzoate polyprenyltransferase
MTETAMSACAEPEFHRTRYPGATHVALPLAVDLDGTLIRSDTLHESLISYLTSAPLSAFRLASSLLRGKAAFKREVAGTAQLDPALLPYNQEFLRFLEQERQSGRQLGLFTAADQSVADAVARHVGLFDLARGSDGQENLDGNRKARAIADAFGGNFAYAGNGPADRSIFAVADQVILVGAIDRLKPMVPQDKETETNFPTPRPSLREWAKALRLRHWAKNLLVLVAPLCGGALLDPAVIGQGLLLFLLFGMVASATYILNDLCDLAADRAHPVKWRRPFASGAISARDGILAAGAMLVVAFGLGLLLPFGAVGSMAAYLAATLCYSFVLKRQPILDVVTLAGLFTLRILAGSFLLEAPPFPSSHILPLSPWLLTFSILFFLGLAMIKRHAEIARVVREGGSRVDSRGYTAEDLPLLLVAGLSSGFSAIAIFTIYLINEQYPLATYHHPTVLWGMMPILLIWILRMWHLTLHGQMDEDPVVFALKDRMSYALGGAAALVLLLAWS